MAPEKPDDPVEGKVGAGLGGSGGGAAEVDCSGGSGGGVSFDAVGGA